MSSLQHSSCPCINSVHATPCMHVPLTWIQHALEGFLNALCACASAWTHEQHSRSPLFMLLGMGLVYIIVFLPCLRSLGRAPPQPQSSQVWRNTHANRIMQRLVTHLSCMHGQCTCTCTHAALAVQIESRSLMTRDVAATDAVTTQARACQSENGCIAWGTACPHQALQCTIPSRSHGL